MGLGQQIINGCTQKQNAPLAYRISLYHALQIMNTSLRVTSYVCTFISRQLGESYRVRAEVVPIHFKAADDLAFWRAEVPGKVIVPDEAVLPGVDLKQPARTKGISL
jgi:hypothetical protein